MNKWMSDDSKKQIFHLELEVQSVKSMDFLWGWKEQQWMQNIHCTIVPVGVNWLNFSDDNHMYVVAKLQISRKYQAVEDG